MCHGICCGYLNVPSTGSMENVGISEEWVSGLGLEEL